MMRLAIRWAAAIALVAVAVMAVTLAGDAATASNINDAQAEITAFPPEHDDSSQEGETHGAAGGGAEDAGAHGGNINPLAIKPDLAIFTAIVFLLTLLVLWKFAWGPISEALDRRERGIAEQIAAAQRSHEEAKQLLAQHQARLKGATEEVRALLDQARRDADMQKQEILAEALRAAQAEKGRALREITAAKNQALHELAEKSVNTAVELAGRIVRRQLRPEDHAELIRNALEQFPSDN